MAWVYFEKDFDYRPTAISVVAYKAGMHRSVKREAAEQAVAGGFGYETDVPKEGEVFNAQNKPERIKVSTIAAAEGAAAEGAAAKGDTAKSKT